VFQKNLFPCDQKKSGQHQPNQGIKILKNISKTFACTLFALTFAAPISSFEIPVNREPAFAKASAGK